MESITSARSLPTLDELTLATEKIAEGASDLDAISIQVHKAIDPEHPTSISLEQVGALFLYAGDCEAQAQEIREKAACILSDVVALYWTQATEENMTGPRARQLVEAWHREVLEGITR